MRTLLNPPLKRMILFVFLAALCPSAGIPQTIYQGPPQSTPQQSRMQLPAGWTVFRGGSGLVVPHPAGWQIQETGGGSFLGYRPGQDGVAKAIVLVKPIERIDGQAMGVVQGVGQIFPDLFPGAQVSRSRIISTVPEVAIGELQFAPMGQPFRGVALCFKHGQKGVLYAIGSSAGSWPQEEGALKYILNNFFYSAGGPGGFSAPPMVSWREPNEGSFSCPVPQGWKVEGGTKRFSPFDVRSEIAVTSPDERVLIRMGDYWIPLMRVPDALVQSMGFREGGWYGTPGIDQALIMRYLPSTTFLTQFYLPQRVGPVTNVRTRDLPQVSPKAQVEAGASMGMLGVRVDAGEITFDCQGEKGPRKGYGFIQTELLGGGPLMPNIGTWRVSMFHGYLAQPEMEPLAQNILTEMVAGCQVDPNWGMAQVRTAGQISNILSQSNNEITGIISQTHDNVSRSQDRIREKWSRVNRGQVAIEDPTTGQRFEVPSGGNYYWRAGAGQEFIGTETADRPYHPNLYIQEMRILP